MKSIIVSLGILISFQCFSQTQREVVQLQLDAYNKGDIEAFLDVFAEDAEAYNYGDAKPFIKGKTILKRPTENYFNRLQSFTVRSSTEVSLVTLS
jgi:ketosteroid isomerase-like protein